MKKIIALLALGTLSSFSNAETNSTDTVETEKEKYEKPVASREYLLELLVKAKKPLSFLEFCQLLNAITLRPNLLFDHVDFLNSTKVRAADIALLRRVELEDFLRRR